MSFILQLLLVILAGWMSRQQQEVIEYLRTENQVLKEKLGKKRVLLTDDERLRLAIQRKFLGRKRLEEVGMLFTPDTTVGNVLKQHGVQHQSRPGCHEPQRDSTFERKMDCASRLLDN